MEESVQPWVLRAHIAAALGDCDVASLAAGVERLAIDSSKVPGSSGNALAESLGGAQGPEDAQLRVHDWLEWEETRLRPAVADLHSAAFAEAARRLAEATATGRCVAADVPTAADAAIFSTLRPVGGHSQVPDGVREYLARLAEAPAFRRGLASALESREASSRQAGPSSPGALPLRPKLPIKGRRNLLITSALPYVNNVPHLGNIVGSVLSADCYARYARSRGHNCVYICGTDEYGTATETKALEEGLTCQEICDKYNAVHAEIYRWFQISFDHFGRTPTWQQTEICQEIFGQLQQEGYILEDTIEQLYSEALGKFLADRFVLGTCPKCGFEDAKGDQCDKCGSMLNPTELVNPRCKVTGTTPVLRSTRHLFLDLPRLTPALQAYITETSTLGGWSANCVATTKSWMRDGLKPRCISRDLVWGTPIPFEGYESKVFYVWFDAPIGYVSITANYTDDWKAWWQNPDDVDLVQFMGKDNVPFHTIIFPATQIGTGRRWTKMRTISVTEYLNYEGGKFSKGRNIGVFGDDAQKTGIPPEVWRYYLLSNRPEVSDTDFKWSDMRARLNNELLANLGNFVNRALVFTANKFGGVAPEALPELTADSPPASGGAPASRAHAWIAQLRSDVAELTRQYLEAMEAIKLRDGVKIAMGVSGRANKFLQVVPVQDTKPWDLLKMGPAERAIGGTIISVTLGLTLLLAALLEPYMPSVSEKILQQLALPPSAARLSDGFLERAARLAGLVPGGHRIGVPEVLFRELSPEIEAHLHQRYGGASQAEPSTANGVAPPPAPARAAPKDGKAAKDAKKAKSNAKDNGAAKEKKDKAPAAKAPAAKTPADISAVDLRVGLITRARKHENAESLYVEDIECGEAAPRQVVSGLVKYIPLDEMQGRRVVIVANLKAGNMRGVKSQAMVLAASSADGTRVELIEPPAGASPGERVTVDGFAGEPAGVLKKDAFDAIAPGLRTDARLLACYEGRPLATSAGPCTVASIADGAIK